MNQDREEFFKTDFLKALKTLLNHFITFGKKVNEVSYQALQQEKISDD